MAKYRNNLPQLSEKLFLTDSGLETTLVFHDGIDLPHFAAFDLMTRTDGRARLRDYFKRHIAIARQAGAGFIFESPTWRASRDWAEKLGYSAAELADVNRASIELLAGMRDEFETPHSPMVISGNIGPRGDGYRPGAMMNVAEARDYHSEQINVFRDTEADMVAGFTLNYVEEAVGIALAARDAAMPVALSFTLETDGKLPSGQSLADAIERVDRDSGAYPVYYMINCAHPTHFEDMLDELGPAIRRVRGLRANASRRSHAALDASTDLDAGDPEELGGEYRRLQRKLPALAVVGGCCGTDHRHVAAIAQAILAS